jgi:hypothetical protein
MAAAGLIIAVSGTAHASACSQSYLPLPDSSCTPGSHNPDLTQSNIHSTICVSGWTDTVRSSTSCTNPLTAQGIIDYWYSDNQHVGLRGGRPRAAGARRCARDPGNLWPEDYRGSFNAHDKDRLEDYLHQAVCSGKMSLRAAQEAIATNWVKAPCNAKLGECPGSTH